MRIQVYRWEGRWKRRVMLIVTHMHVFVSRKVMQIHVVLQRAHLIVRSQWAKQWKLSAQTCPRMSKVAHGRVFVSQKGAESYRGQSSCLVVLRGWCLYSMVVMHTYLLRHMAEKNRGQCLEKCTGGWVEHVQVVTKLDRNRSRMSIITQLLIIIIIIKCLLT